MQLYGMQLLKRVGFGMDGWIARLGLFRKCRSDISVDPRHKADARSLQHRAGGRAQEGERMGGGGGVRWGCDAVRCLSGLCCATIARTAVGNLTSSFLADCLLVSRKT